MFGVVKWFDIKKGYGFVKSDDYEDIFIHYSEIIEKGFRILEENDLVYFDLIITEQGLKANNLHIIKSDL